MPLTIVSGGIIYVEGSLTLSDDNSALGLLARDAVCVNATALTPAVGAGISGYSINSLVYSERGPFAAIPPIGSISPNVRFELAFTGAISENEHYSGVEWARAFGRIVWSHDLRFRDPDRRPPWLACELSRVS